MRVLLLAGAWSSEAEISLLGAKVIKEALEERGHEVTLCNPLYEFDSIISLAKKHDVSFINMHGSPGEDGLIQALLDSVGCPYQGSDPAGSFLALHKAAAKQIFRFSGLLTPDWHYLPTPPPSTWQPTFFYPIFAKSNMGGSSLHLAKVERFEDLHAVLNKLFAAGQEVIVEPLIKGQEVTCGVLEMKGELQALPPILIKPKGNTFFDYTNKYAKDGAEEICPAPLPEPILEQIKEVALKAHKVLKLKGYSRSDFILAEDNQLYLLETNTIPGMTATSLVPREARTIGISFGELVENLLLTALKQ